MGELIIADFKNKNKNKKKATYDAALMKQEADDLFLKERLANIQSSVNRINALIVELKTCGSKKHLTDADLDIILHDI